MLLSYWKHSKNFDTACFDIIHATHNQYTFHTLIHAGTMAFRVIRLIQKDQSGGHNYEFINSVPDRFNCSICTNVLCEPELAVCCGQHFCEQCMKKWFLKQRKESCPHCRAEGSRFQHVTNKGLRSEINQLQIRCSKRALGCTWIGELGNIQQHLTSNTGCNYTQVECSNHCGTRPCRKDLTTHLKNDCQLRRVTCQHCKKQDTFSAINKHESVCPKFPVYCPNRCSYVNGSMYRENLPAHMKICPLEGQSCPFEEAGCKVRAKRDNLTKHVADNQAQHLLMLMETNKKTLEELRQTKQELQQVKQDFAKTNNKLEHEVEALKAMKRALAFEVNAIENSSTPTERTGAFRSIQAQLKVEELDRLNSLIFRVLDFSKHAREGTTWYSPPFIIEYYKVCLAVKPKGVGSGVGSHASLSLVLLDITSSSADSENFNRALNEIRILVPLFKMTPTAIHRVLLKDIKSGGAIDLSPLTEGEIKRTLGTVDEWISHGVVARELEKQSLLLKMERASSFDSLHAALLTSAMRSDCRTS